MSRRLFVPLLGFSFLVNFGRTAFAPLLPELQAVFGVGPAAVGVVATLVWLGSGAVRFPVGYLLTRVAQHRVVVATGAFLVVAAAVTATAESIVVLQLGALCVGLASGAYFAAAVPLISDLFPGQMGRAIGIHGTAAQLAAVVAPTVAVVVLAVRSWRAAFWLLALGALLVTAVLAVAVRRSGGRVASSPDRSFGAALGNWRLIGTGILMVATAGFVWQGLFNFYVSYLSTAKGLSTPLAGTLLTVTFAAGVPAFWLSGRLADRLPHVPYIVGLLSGFTLGVAGLVFARGLPALVVTSVLVGYLIHSLFPALDAYVLGTLPSETRGSTYAVFSGISLLLEALGSTAVGVLLETGASFDTVFGSFAVLLGGVVSVLAVLAVTGRLPGVRGWRPAAYPTER